MVEEGFRVTYATMSGDDEELHAAFERGIETARSWLGQKHPFYVNGEAREGEGWREERSPMPINTTPLPIGITSPPSRVALPCSWSGSPYHT